MHFCHAANRCADALLYLLPEPRGSCPDSVAPNVQQFLFSDSVGYSINDIYAVVVSFGSCHSEVGGRSSRCPSASNSHGKFTP